MAPLCGFHVSRTGNSKRKDSGRSRGQVLPLDGATRAGGTQRQSSGSIRSELGWGGG